MTHSLRTALAVASLGTALALVLVAAPARADTTIGGDLDYAAPIDSNAGSGWGFAVRLGQQFHVPLLAMNPEIGFNYDAFGSASTIAYRGIAGLRLGIGEVIRPGIYGHLGVARLDFDQAPDRSHTAFTYDVGLFLELTVIPLLNVGIHVAYDSIAESDRVDTFKWWNLGAHANLVF